MAEKLENTKNWPVLIEDIIVRLKVSPIVPEAPTELYTQCFTLTVAQNVLPLLICLHL